MTVTPPEIVHTKLGVSRRLAIPAELCQRYGLAPGGPVVIEATESGLMVRPLERVLDEVQSYFAAVAPREAVLSEELLRERREEAGRESHD